MLVKRNLLMFFRDRANVFFSLLAVFIIIGLYVLFLGDMMEQALRSQIGFESGKIGITMASVTLAGMVAVTSVTSSMGAVGVSIADKDKGNAAKDFLTSPVSRGKITLCYILGSAGVGFIMTMAALILVLVYISLNGGTLPGVDGYIRLLLTTLLSVLCGNSIVFFVSVFIRSENAFSAFSTVIGTLIGFLMGIYIPIGQLPDSVQWVIKCFPMTHAASMFRQVLADGELTVLFKDTPPEALDGFRRVFGIVLVYGDFVSSFWFSAAVLAATTAVFYIASLLAMKTRRGE